MQVRSGKSRSGPGFLQKVVLGYVLLDTTTAVREIIWLAKLKIFTLRPLKAISAGLWESMARVGFYLSITLGQCQDGLVPPSLWIGRRLGVCFGEGEYEQLCSVRGL